MARSEIIGSWHNSGFHGHFRSKSRNDFICEYRQLAKPQPPKDFVKRAREKSAKHAFSHHDNRHSFMNDALYFEEGLGRRRLPNKTNTAKEDLLTWMPYKDEFKRKPHPPSTYKVDYRGVPMQPMKTQLVPRPVTSFDDDRGSTTTYRYSHCRDNPNKSALDVMSNIGLTTVPNRRQKASLAATRDTVANCLSWYRPATSTPAATQTVAPPQDPPRPKTSCGSTTTIVALDTTTNTAPVVVPQPTQTQEVVPQPIPQPIPPPKEMVAAV